MIKKNFIKLTIFLLFVLISISYFIPITHGINATISDTEDDVLRQCTSGDTTGDFHDEIDIIKLTVAGKNVNLTVAGNLGQWNSSYYGTIIFSEKFYSLFHCRCLREKYNSP